jgi:hypothetical protein
MLMEDDVVNAVVELLRKYDWSIESVAYAHERGDDIVAAKGGVRLRVEAKGAGSSKSGTKRYGLPFTGNQVGSHVGVAVVRALRWASRGDDRAALAFPDNSHHRAQVDAITPALEKVGIGIFWVAEDGHVTLSSPWVL